MLNKERELEIINILNTSGGFVSVKRLCDELYASESSIRRDLKKLENRQIIKRIYGGAELITKHSQISAFAIRIHKNSAAKTIIAEKALSLISDGDVIFLDQSSTAFYLAEKLKEKSSLTVITNNTEILTLLSESKIKVFSSGGYLSSENRNCLIGKNAEKAFCEVYADTVFFSAKSVSEEGVITDCYPEETAVRDCMLKNSTKKVFLCDETKLNTKAYWHQCTVNDIDVIVSDTDTAKSLLKINKNLTVL